MQSFTYMISHFFTIILIPISTGIAFSQGTAITDPVQFSTAGGMYTGTVEVGLTCSTPGAAIRFTLDGREPDSSATLYDGMPFLFDSIAVLRARAFAVGMAPSRVVTHSYLAGVEHSFPVVSLAFDPAAFFDADTGIYVKYLDDLTALANIEMFVPEANDAVFNQLVAVEIQGSASASQPQKSLEISAKGSLGNPTIAYPLFPELPFESYKRFVLRNGGQDWCVLQFRDEFAAGLLTDRSDMGDLLAAPALYAQAWRPAVLYLNGKYWGIHNIRERMNRFYVQQHFNWSSDAFDLVDNFGSVSNGDIAAWNDLFGYLTQTTGFDNDSLFEALEQQIDGQNFLDYCVFNIYLENEDWPGNNVRRFRQRSPEGKWRWMTYDLDFTFGLFQQNGGWNTGDASPDALARMLDDTTQVWPNPDWATLLFRRCWQNAGFRRDFANRLADMLNTAFLPARVSDRLNAFRTLYQPEITKHYERWWFGNYDSYWLANIETTRQFAFHRPDYVRQEILKAVPEASGLAELEIKANPPAGGRVEVNTVSPTAAQLPWSGIYFTGVALPVRAIANPGYLFTGWSDPDLGIKDSTNIVLSGNTVLVANFEKEDTVTTHTANMEWPVFSLYPNPADKTLTIKGKFAENAEVSVRILDGFSRQIAGPWRLTGREINHVSPDLSGLPGGVYFLKIEGVNGAVTRKFLVVR
jgi:hypothetical protein